MASNQSSFSRNPRFYRMSDLARSRAGAGLLGGVSTATVWRWVKQGNFPPPVKLGPQVTAFPAEHVEAWIADRVSSAVFK